MRHRRDVDQQDALPIRPRRRWREHKKQVRVHTAELSTRDLLLDFTLYQVLTKFPPLHRAFDFLKKITMA